MRSAHSVIWTHLVFSAKNHQPVFEGEGVPVIRQALDDFFTEIPDHQGTFGILADHIHLLIKLPENMSVNQLARQKQKLVSERLLQHGWVVKVEWENDYHAHPVSWNRLSNEKSLIERQEIKHKDLSLKEELKFLGL